MLKKISAKQDEKIEAAEQAKLATDVGELYQAAISGKLADHAAVNDDEVREVAFGLTVLRQMTDHHLKKFEADRDLTRLPSSGLCEASRIIDALTTGNDHVIFRYIKGLRASRKRSDQECHKMLGGLVHAYAEAKAKGKKPNIRKAALAVVEFIEPNGRFDDEQLRRWARMDVSRHTERFLNDAKASAGDRPLAEEVLKVGRLHFWRHWTTPSVKSG
jgi:hypothetical protein